MQSMRIAIIGGGPGGLMTAYLLEQRLTEPYAITLFEASDRLGGKIVTRQFDSAPVAYEADAAELYDYYQLELDPLRDLVQSFGLTTRLERTRKPWRQRWPKRATLRPPSRSWTKRWRTRRRKSRPGCDTGARFIS